MAFLRFFIKYVASKLSIPFWMVGHVHLTMNVYDDLIEIFMSFGLNFIVFMAFWFEWMDSKSKDNNSKVKQ
jgi:hypothetical protein